MNNYIIVEQYCDNGAVSHYDVIDAKTGETLVTDVFDYEEIQAQRVERITDLERQLVLIGEKAVVDFDDEVVGVVDKAVPNGGKYKDWIRRVLDAGRRVKELEQQLAESKEKHAHDCDVLNNLIDDLQKQLTESVPFSVMQNNCTHAETINKESCCGVSMELCETKANCPLIAQIGGE